MKKEKLGQEQAFPILEQSGNPEIWNSYNGMSKRFFATCAALKSPLLRADDLCDDDMVEDAEGAYIKNTSGGYFAPNTYVYRDKSQHYSIKPEVTEIKRIIRYASKLADELLTQENE